MTLQISEPKTEKEFERYYDLRWRILRQPWNQPKGSEKDELDVQSIHITVYEDGTLVGIGRAHYNSPEEAQIRYMAVENGQQGRGIGGLVLGELENKMFEKGVNVIVLNARESAIPFYQKHGYITMGDAPTMFGVIHHKKMRKELR